MIGAFFRALGAPFRILMDPEGRRAWALMLLAGSAITMTAYVVWALWIVKGVPKYAFYLGMLGFLMVGIVVTGFAGLLVRRSVDLSALGVRFKVDDKEIDTIAQRVAAAMPAPPTPAAPPAAVIVQTGSPPAGEPK